MGGLPASLAAYFFLSGHDKDTDSAHFERGPPTGIHPFASAYGVADVHDVWQHGLLLPFGHKKAMNSGFFNRRPTGGHHFLSFGHNKATGSAFFTGRTTVSSPVETSYGYCNGGLLAEITLPCFSHVKATDSAIGGLGQIFPCLLRLGQGGGYCNRGTGHWPASCIASNFPSPMLGRG